MTDPTLDLKPFVRQKAVLFATYRQDGIPLGAL
jgi:hypothetical protein